MRRRSFAWVRVRWRDGLGAEAEGGGAGFAEGGGFGDEVDEEASGVAGVDDFFDPEGFGGAEGGAEAFEPFFDFGEFGVGVGSGVDVGAVGGFDTAFEGEGSPAGGGPGVAGGEALAVAVGGAGDAEEVADDDGAPGHGGLEEGGHGADAVADGGVLFGLGADKEAGAVDEVDDGEVEGLGEVDEADDFVAGVGGPGAAVVVGVGGEEGDGPAVDAGEAGDEGAAEIGADFEEGVVVDEGFDDGAHFVDLAPVAGDGGEEGFVAAVGVIGGGESWGEAVDGGGEVGEEASGVGEGVVFGVDGLVDGAVAGVDVVSAELLLVEGLADAFDDGGTGNEEGGGVFDEDGVVAGGEVGGAEAGDGSEAEGDAGDGGEVVDDPFPAFDAGDVGAAVGFDGFDGAAAAGAFDEADEGEAELVGHLFGEDVFGADGGVGGAAADGEVVGDDDDGAVVNAAAADDDVGGGEVDEFAGIVVLGAAGDGAGFVEGAVVEEAVDPFASGEASAFVLALHFVGAAHLVGEGLTALEFVEFGLPGHGVVSPGRGLVGGPSMAGRGW